MDHGVAASPVTGATAQLAMAVAAVTMADGAEPRLWHRAVGQGYAAGRMVHGALQSVDGGAWIRFVMPAGLQAAFVRLRLAAIPGSYRVDGVSVSGEAVPALAARVIQVLDQRLPCVDAGAVRLSCATRPPTLELDLRGLPTALARPWDLRVRVVREDSAAANGASEAALRALSDDLDALARSREDEAFAAAGRQRQADGKLHGRMDAVAQEIEKHGLERHHEVVARVDEMAGSLASLDERLRADVSVRMDRHASALAAIDDGLETRFAGVVSARDETRSRLDAQAAVLASVAGEIGALRADVAALVPQVAALRHSVDNVFWRRWLRRMRGSL